MININITRKCGHVEMIAMSNASNHVSRDIWESNLAWAKDKLCLPCFEKLETEEKVRLTKEAIEWADRIDATLLENEKMWKRQGSGATRGTSCLTPVAETLRQFVKFDNLIRETDGHINVQGKERQDSDRTEGDERNSQSYEE